MSAGMQLPHSNAQYSKTERTIRRAKRKARSELVEISNGWTYCNFAELVDLHLFSKLANNGENIPRIDANNITVREFRERFEGGVGAPVILLNTQQNWLAKDRWTVERLACKYRNQYFKVGEDDDGYSVKLKMKYYVQYMRSTQDDSPLYIFDRSYGDRAKTKRLLEDYEVPNFFQDDLFRYAGERKRPPYRWFVMGPGRSGTNIHIDPLGTSAWNALVHGSKLWVLLPPSCPRQLAKSRPADCGGWRRNFSEAISWFLYVFPRVMDPSWPAEFQPIRFVQRAGETVFVPSGWWHVVLNLEETIAVTQNFCSPVNFPTVYRHTLQKRPKLATKWHHALSKVRPELSQTMASIQSNLSSLTYGTHGGSSSSSASSSSSSVDLSSVDTESSSSATSTASCSSCDEKTKKRRLDNSKAAAKGDRT